MLDWDRSGASLKAAKKLGLGYLILLRWPNNAVKTVGRRISYMSTLPRKRIMFNGGKYLNFEQE